MSVRYSSKTAKEGRDEGRKEGRREAGSDGVLLRTITAARGPATLIREGTGGGCRLRQLRLRAANNRLGGLQIKQREFLVGNPPFVN